MNRLKYTISLLNINGKMGNIVASIKYLTFRIIKLKYGVVFYVLEPLIIIARVWAFCLIWNLTILVFLILNMHVRIRNWEFCLLSRLSGK